MVGLIHKDINYPQISYLFYRLITGINYTPGSGSMAAGIIKKAGSIRACSLLYVYRL
jgi:hypothetical protein